MQSPAFGQECSGNPALTSGPFCYSPGSHAPASRQPKLWPLPLRSAGLLCPTWTPLAHTEGWQAWSSPQSLLPASASGTQRSAPENNCLRCLAACYSSYGTKIRGLLGELEGAVILVAAGSRVGDERRARVGSRTSRMVRAQWPPCPAGAGG